MSSKKNIKFKCPYCDKRFTREELVRHIDDFHEEMIPEGYSSFRLVFNYVNKKPMEYNGKCTECGGPTRWDENKGRYDRQCNKPSCRSSYLKKFENNMLRTKGVTRISSTAEGQAKMLANRKISGTYKFQNGVEKTYTGSYELKALEFMDKVLNINPDDISCPGPILEYTYKDKKHLYITDFYYIPYNLVIEVKDGGKNPNKRDMPDYRGKQIAKEEYIIKNTNYNYLRLTDNDLSQLLAVFMDLKMQMVENNLDRVIHVNEDYVFESIKNDKYYRLTYNGIGIYEAFKNHCSYNEWREFLNSNAAKWLPKPKIYEDKNNLNSYFTNIGYNMFIKNTYPVFVKKLNSELIKIDIYTNIYGNVLYKDKYQIVVENSEILESTKSTLNKDYKPKGKKNLSSFKIIHITETIIDKYKKEYPFLKHVRCKDTKEYICDGYIWFDNNELVAMVGSCEYTDDKTKWIVSLEITKNYKGYGLSKQILDYATKTMNCKYLSVNKNNKIAKKVYDDYGFKVYQESDSMYYMTIDKNINEAMNALMTGYIPGIDSEGSVYVVNYMQNNVFSGEEERGYGISDNPKLTNLICRNKEGILTKAPSDLLEKCKYDVYMVNINKDELSKKISPYMEKFVSESFIYESIFGKKMYSYDQIMTEESAIPVIDYYKGLDLLGEMVHNFIMGKSNNDEYVVMNENSIMSLNYCSESKDISCITYTSLVNGKYRVESAEYPELALESNTPLDNNSVESKFIKLLTSFRRE